MCQSFQVLFFLQWSYFYDNETPIEPVHLDVCPIGLGGVWYYVDTLYTLYQILKVCRRFLFSGIFTALYLFSFFSVLRLSNILLHSSKTFDPTRQLCWGDIVDTDHAVIVIKWSETLQDMQKCTTIVIPLLDHPPLSSGRN